MNAFRILIVCALLLAGQAGAAAPTMREGLWEVSAAVEGHKAPPTTVQHCMTKKDMENPAKFVSGGEGTGCEIKDHKTQSNVVTWNMACTGKTPMTGSGSITFAETSYTGRSTLTVTRGDKPVQMTIRYNGKYLGPCRK
jgi:hypothetical protein